MCQNPKGSAPTPGAGSTSQVQNQTQYGTTSQAITPSQVALPLYQQYLGTTVPSLAATPYNPATEAQVAPWTPEQTAAASNLYSLGMSAGTFDPNQILSIMSPYNQAVVQATQEQFNNQNAIANNALLAQSIGSGNAFGGDRAGVAQAQLAGQQQTAQAPVIAGLIQSGYTQAEAEDLALRSLGLTGGQIAFQGASLPTQQQQQILNTAQQNAIAQQAYPFTLANWEAQNLAGIGPLTGTTGTTGYASNLAGTGYVTPPQPNPWVQGIGAATTLAGALPAGFNPWATVPNPTGPSGAGATIYPNPIGPVYGGARRGGLIRLPLRYQGGGEVGGSAFPGTPYSGIRLAGGRAPGLVFSLGAGPQAAQPMALPQTNAPAFTSMFGPNTPLGSATRGSSTGTGATGDIGALAALGAKILPMFMQGGGEVHAARAMDLPPVHIPNWISMGSAPASGSGTPQLSPDAQIGKAVGTAAGTAAFGPVGGVIGGLGGQYIGGMFKRGGLAYQEGGDVADEPEPQFTARGSWYSQAPGWRDTGDRPGSNVLGVPDIQQGIALPRRSTIGDYYNVWLPGRDTPELLRQTDVGPARWTGRGIDISAAAAREAGFTPRTYPTNAPVAYAPVSAMGSPPGLPEAQPRLPGGVSAARDLPSLITRGTDDDEDGAGGATRAGPGSVTQIPGLGIRPPTPGQEWATNPLTAAGLAMMRTHNPYLLGGIGEGIAGAAGALQAQREQDVKLDTQHKMIDLEDGTIGFLTADGKLIRTPLKKQVAAKFQRIGEKLYRVMPDGSLQEAKVPATEPDRAVGTLVPGIAATAADATALVQSENGDLPANARLAAHGMFDYSTGSPGTIKQGYEIPEPAPIEPRGAAPGYSPQTIKTAAENYVQNGPKALPTVRGTKGAPAENLLKFQAAVRSYGDSLMAAAGLSEKEIATKWRQAPFMGRWLFNPQGGLGTGAISTVMNHINTLDRIYAAMAKTPYGGYDTPALNKLMGEVGKQLGVAAPQTLENAAQLVGAEIIRAIGVAGGGTGEDRAKATSMWSGKLSPEQWGGEMGTKTQILHLLAGNLETRERIANEASIPPDMFKRIVGEANYKYLDELRKAEAGTGTTSTTPPAKTTTTTESKTTPPVVAPPTVDGHAPQVQNGVTFVWDAAAKGYKKWTPPR